MTTFLVAYQWSRAKILRLKSRLLLRTRIKRAIRVFPRRAKSYWRWKIVKTRFGIEVVRNWVIDRRYGGSCAGRYATPYSLLGAHGTSSVDYYQLPRLFCPQNGTVIKNSDVLVDVGCGKGRVINWWLSSGLANKMIGIELDERFAGMAAERLSKYPNVQIICGNALDHIPKDGTVFFLFNPFNANLMESFKERLLEGVRPEADMTLVYSYCKHIEVFKSDSRWTVEPVRTKTFYPAAIVRLGRASHQKSETRNQRSPVASTLGL